MSKFIALSIWEHKRELCKIGILVSKVREIVSPWAKTHGLKRDAHNETTISLVHR